MKLKLAVAVVTFALGLRALPASATLAETEDSVDGFSLALAVANTALAITNGYQWKHDGGIETGSLGIVMGTLSIAFTIAQTEALGTNRTVVLSSIAFAGVITGAGALQRGRRVRDEPQSRLELAPSFTVSERRPVLGLQLIASW